MPRVIALLVVVLSVAVCAPARATPLYPWPSDRYTRADPTTDTAGG
jgi:hypothetical protein